MKKLLLILSVTYVLSRMMAVRADYVMPYPSYMPGNGMYRFSRIVDALKYYWYWGNIAQIKYHLTLSDKYLVEAKTLMEYNQFLLGSDALTRSDREFQQLPAYVARTKGEHTAVSEFQQLILSAADKHIRILKDMQAMAPATLTWTPEKSASTVLPLGAMLQTAIDIRRAVATEVGSL